MRTRRYRPSDHDAVWALHYLALRAVDADAGDGPWHDDLRDIEGAYLDGTGEFLVGEDGGAIVAMGALRRTGPSRAEIKRMRVHPDHQRRGYGTAVLQALEARARELGCRTLHLDTTARQAGARRFYEKHGFRRTGAKTWGQFRLVYYERRLDDGGGQDANR